MGQAICIALVVIWMAAIIVFMNEGFTYLSLQNQLAREQLERSEKDECTK